MKVASKVHWETFSTGWLPPVRVENDSSLLILNKWGYWATTGLCACDLKRAWGLSNVFMQLTAWHGAQCCWVEVIISLKCLGGCLQGMTSYAVARGTENSIPLNTTDQSSRVILQKWKGCRSKAEADQTIQAFIHVSFSSLVTRSNGENHNNEKRPV